MSTRLNAAPVRSATALPCHIGGLASTVLAVMLLVQSAASSNTAALPANTVGSTVQPFNGSTVQRLDRSTVERLTTDGNLKQHPAWSPDGKLLVCTIYLKGKVGLVQKSPADAEWKHLTPLDENPEYEAAWSPDGARIVFVQDSLSGTDGQLRLHVMNADGSEPKQLVAPANRPSQDEHPAWSPDGKTLAFTTTRAGNQEIYMCDSDGSNVRRITTSPGVDSHPTWSPDGKRIAFCSVRFGNMEICAMNADGSQVQRLTDHAALDYSPKWSPDGRYIAFTSTRDGNYEVYLVRPDGSGLANLTRHVGLDKDATWGPDGRSVTFLSNRDGRFDLYRVGI